MYRYSQQPSLAKRKKRRASGNRSRSHTRRQYAVSFRKSSGKSYTPFLLKIVATGLGCLLLFGAIRFWTMIVSGLSIIHDMQSASIMDEGRTNIVFNDGSVSILSFGRADNSLAVFTIPDSVYVTAQSGDKYKIASLYGIAELNQPGSGGRALERAVQNTFGLFIDGYVQSNALTQATLSQNTIQQTLGSWQFPFAVLNNDGIMKNAQSSLTKTDYLKLWWRIHTMRFDHLSVTDLSQTQAFVPDELADGTQILGVSTDGVDAALGDAAKDLDITQEGAKVSVINASGVPGNAERFARMLTNLGAHVVSVKSADTPQPTSHIVVYNKANVPMLLQRLSKMPKFTILYAQNGDTQLSDVSIILGEQ